MYIYIYNIVCSTDLFVQLSFTFPGSSSILAWSQHSWHRRHPWPHGWAAHVQWLRGDATSSSCWATKICWVHNPKNTWRLDDWITENHSTKEISGSQLDTLLVQACFGGKILTNTYQINVVSVDGNTGVVDLKVLQKSICHCFDAQIVDQDVM